MFGGSFDLAILSGPLALPGFTAGKAVLVVWVYAIAGVCGVRVILFTAPRRFCPIATIASWVFCSDQPEISGAVHVKAALHCAKAVLKHCSTFQAAFGDQPAPAFFPGTQVPACALGPVRRCPCGPC